MKYLHCNRRPTVGRRVSPLGVRLLKACLAFLLLTAGLLTAWSQPAQVVIIRHAEKPDDPDALHLSARGEERAKALVKFFTENRKVTRYGQPVALYATDPTKRGRGQRPFETLEPTSKELKLPIQTPYQSEDYEKLARLIMTQTNYQGKTVVICWTHDDLPEFAAAFGVKPKPDKWKDSVYDRAYIINFQGGTPDLDTIAQKVLKDDAKK
jgi:hypothetical protein